MGHLLPKYYFFVSFGKFIFPKFIAGNYFIYFYDENIVTFISVFSDPV